MNKERSGRGQVLSEDGTHLGVVEYFLVISQPSHKMPTKHGQRSYPGYKSVSGKVVGLDMFGLLTARLTLVLDDGGRLEFEVGDPSMGTIIANTGIYSA
jgi:hypothetical protein